MLSTLISRWILNTFHCMCIAHTDDQFYLCTISHHTISYYICYVKSYHIILRTVDDCGAMWNRSYSKRNKVLRWLCSITTLTPGPHTERVRTCARTFVFHFHALKFKRSLLFQCSAHKYLLMYSTHAQMHTNTSAYTKVHKYVHTYIHTHTHTHQHVRIDVVVAMF